MLTLGLKSSVTRDLSEEIFRSIFDYFKDIKSGRTIDDVSNIFTIIQKSYKKHLIEISENDLKDLQKEIIDSTSNLIDSNSMNINDLAKDPLVNEMLSYWIYNLNLAIDLLSNSLEKDYKYMSHLSRRRGFEKTVSEQFKNILYAAFLVFYRVLEQSYLLLMRFPFDKEQEIELLIEDLVYLKNIYRMNKN